MFEVIIQGLFSGLFLAFMVGPVFIILLETSITKGAKAAIIFDLGVLFSDLVYALIAFFFYSEAEKLMGDKTTLYLIGGGILFLFGMFTFLKKTVPESKIKTDKKASGILSFFKGFVLNIFHPGALPYWFSVVSIGQSVSNGEDQLAIFLTFVFVGFFATDLLKIFGAKKLKPFITGRRLIIFVKTSGLILAAVGCFLIIKGLGIIP